jgi:hypothetical protein
MRVPWKVATGITIKVNASASKTSDPNLAHLGTAGSLLFSMAEGHDDFRR